MRNDTTHKAYTRKTRALLWSLQGLLALLFVFAGGMKLAIPLGVLAEQSPLPPLFLKFIGMAEVAGALGLVLPGLLRVGAGLTSLAACGLVIIMIGATTVTATGGQLGGAIFPGVTGLLAAFVAYKRWPETGGFGAALVAALRRTEPTQANACPPRSPAS